MTDRSKLASRAGTAMSDFLILANGISALDCWITDMKSTKLWSVDVLPRNIIYPTQAAEPCNHVQRKALTE
jgi:hypothetical protein